MSDTTSVIENSSKSANKREEIRRKVEASQAQLAARRNGEGEPPEGLRALAMDYPFALVAGSVVVGAVVGALLPRSPFRKLAGGAAALATVAGELGMVYGRQALDKAGEAAGKLEDLRGDLGESAADYSRRATTLIGTASRVAGEVIQEAAKSALQAGEVMQDKVLDAAATAQKSTREAGAKVGRQAIRLRSHIRH